MVKFVPTGKTYVNPWNAIVFIEHNDCVSSKSLITEGCPDVEVSGNIRLLISECLETIIKGSYKIKLELVEEKEFKAVYNVLITPEHHSITTATLTVLDINYIAKNHDVE